MLKFEHFAATARELRTALTSTQTAVRRGQARSRLHKDRRRWLRSHSRLAPMSWTITPADIQRILDAIKRDVGQILDSTVSPPAMRDLTAAECFAIIASRFETSLREMAKNSERQATAIPDVVMT